MSEDRAAALALARRLPKVELHRHLEGAVRLDTLIDIARQNAFEMPDYDPELLRPFVQMMPGETRDWQHFLAKFATLRQFFRSPQIIQRITREAVADAAADNVVYLELRFTPKALSNIIRATPHQVIDWVCQAAEEAAAEHGIEVGLIASINRHESIAFGQQVLDAAIAHCDQGIVGFDLAGQEVGHPASLFRPLFEQAKEAGLGVTIHAGEWDGPQSVWDAVGNLGADRVGHGIRAMEDPGIVSVLVERGTVLEVCPTSNVHTGVVKSLAVHPLPQMLRHGIAATLNTDDPLISDITLSDELARAYHDIGMGLDTLKQCILHAAQAAFLPPARRDALVTRLQSQLKAITLP